MYQYFVSVCPVCITLIIQFYFFTTYTSGDPEDFEGYHRDLLTISIYSEGEIAEVYYCYYAIMCTGCST